MDHSDDLDEILSEFEEVTGVKKSATIPLSKVKAWMQSENIEVLGAVYTLIMEKTCYPRVHPPLSPDDYQIFLMHYYGRCFRENPTNKWADTRYTAGWDLVNWFRGLWKDPATPPHLVTKLKKWLAQLCKEGDEELRTCIVTATLEHLFEDPEIATFFSEWGQDPRLREVYREAMGYAKQLRRSGGTDARKSP